MSSTSAPDKLAATHIFLAALALLALIALAYQDAPANIFHLDDMENIVRHAPLWLDELSLEGLLNAGREAAIGTRPLPSVTFALDWWRGGGKPAAFQWTNLALHGMAALALLALLCTLMRRCCGPLDRRLLGCAFLGAAFWALHPIQIQGVTYIVQRMASMAALFTLLSVWAYVRGRLSSGRGVPWFFFCGLFFLLGTISKENALITPALWLLAEYGICRHGEPLVRGRWDYLWLSLPVVLGVYILADLASGAGPLYHFAQGGYANRDFTLEQRLLTQPRVVLFHLSQIIWPLPGRFSIEHAFPLSTGLLQPASTLAAILFVLAWTGAGLWLLLSRHRRLWGFCMLWIPLTLGIESSIIPLEMVFEHRMYLPLTGLAGLLALGLAAASRQKTWIFITACLLAAAFITACLAVTLQRVPDWRSRIALFESALPHAATSARVWSILGLGYTADGRLQEGAEAAQRALQLDPNEPYALETMAVVLMDQGQWEAAERYFNRAYAINGAEPPLMNHWGELKLKRGLYSEALRLFLAASQAVPWQPIYHWNIALTYEQLSECAMAKSHWERYLRLETDPGERRIVKAHLAEEHQAPGGKCAAAAD